MLKGSETIGPIAQDMIESALGRFEPVRVAYPEDYAPVRCNLAASLVDDYFRTLDSVGCITPLALHGSR